jgi:anti-sigma regulatory factor (Ser/Thr protein kinase)
VSRTDDASGTDGRSVGTRSGMPTSCLHVRFAADPASVPGARRFVVDGLHAWGLDEIVDDAALCISELAGNAALHSVSTFMRVEVWRSGDVVRVSVEDDGDVPLAVVVPRADYGPGSVAPYPELESEPTTGRGLAIVGFIASAWGVERTRDGNRIWAELGGDGAVVGPTVEEPAAPTTEGGPLPPDWDLVRLVGCPVRLSLRQDEHLDELMREFQLLSADRDNDDSLALARQIEGLLHAPAHARFTGRRLAEVADRAGRTEVDIDMAMPRLAATWIRELDRAVRAADTLCEEQRLLTLASTQDLRDLRAWMTESIVAQIERGAAPEAWQDWRARRA